MLFQYLTHIFILLFSLAANIVASSFGKLVSKEDPAQGLTQEDLARALLSLVTNNIGQVAYLNAKLHNTPRIYFVGSFLRENMISQRRLSYAINYWSKGEMEALFLEHEGYFGALGAFLMSQNIECRKGGFYQWESDCWWNLSLCKVITWRRNYCSIYNDSFMNFGFFTALQAFKKVTLLFSTLATLAMQ